MTDRLQVAKTYKLFIGGKFPRSESGRTMRAESASGELVAHVCLASRKDFREAVEAARAVQPAWAGATAYLRGQIVYRIAEMMEGKRDELARAILATGGAADLRAARREVDASIDRVIHYAGWADKIAQVLGCQNPVSGPYYNFTVPQPTGVVAAVCPDGAPLLGLVSLVAPALCAGNSVVALGSTRHPIPAAVLGEVMATSDVPGGAVNLLTGDRAELLSHIASHRGVDAITCANLAKKEAAALRAGVAENIKRIAVRAKVDWNDPAAAQGPAWIESTVEMKTIWHPSAV